MEDARMDNLIARAAKDISLSKRIVALTGAGISTESGIPDFRSPGGIWEKYDPEEFTYEKFLDDPVRLWMMHIDMGKSFKGAKPNGAHYALAKLEEMGKLRCIITQNIDNLHREAGSVSVIEFHGNMGRARCQSCDMCLPYKEAEELVMRGENPPKCKCGGILKPDIVLFGEQIPLEALIKSHEEARNCDLMLVIGTSGVIYPAAEIPLIAKRADRFKPGFGADSILEPEDRGAALIEINRDRTSLTHMADYAIEGNAGDILPEIVERVQRLLKRSS